MRGSIYAESVFSDTDSSSAVEGFPNSRVSNNVSSFSLPQRPVKRRKTGGLNSRFDSMMKTVNVLAHSPISEPPRRKRIPSSSSAASHDVPKTPVDAYNNLNDGRLGRNFSVIKLKETRNAQGSAHYAAALDVGHFDTQEAPKAPVPAWLRNVVSGLEQQHPLRILLPSNSLDELMAEHVAQQSLDDHQVQDGFTNPIFFFGPDSDFPLQQNEDEAQDVSYSDDLAILNVESGTHTTMSFVTDSLLDTPTLIEDQNSPVETLLHNLSDDSATLVNEFIQLAPDRPLPFSTPGPSSDLSSLKPVLQRLLPAAMHDSHNIPDYMLTAELLNADEEADAGLLPFSEPGSITCAPTYLASTARSPAPGITSPNFAVHRDFPVPLLSPINLNLKTAYPPPGLVSGPTKHLSKPKTVQTDLPDASPFRFYFDTPMEDPCSSDPIDEENYVLPLDYGVGELGSKPLEMTGFNFRWEKFDRSGERKGNGASLRTFEPEPRAPSALRTALPVSDAGIVNVSSPRGNDEWGGICEEAEGEDDYLLSPSWNSPALQGSKAPPDGKENVNIKLQLDGQIARARPSFARAAAGTPNVHDRMASQRRESPIEMDSPRRTSDADMDATDTSFQQSPSTPLRDANKSIEEDEVTDELSQDSHDTIVSWSDMDKV